VTEPVDPVDPVEPVEPFEPVVPVAPGVVPVVVAPPAVVVGVEPGGGANVAKAGAEKPETSALVPVPSGRTAATAYR
jgi:hypothetical protein